MQKKTGGAKGVKDVLLNNDDYLTEMVTIFSLINKILDDQKFINCIISGVLNNDKTMQRKVCDKLSTMLKNNGDIESAKLVMERYSFILPTIVLYVLKINRAVQLSCDTLTNEEREKIEKNFNETLELIERTGKYMDLKKLNSEYTIVESVVSNKKSEEKDEKKESFCSSGCMGGCNCGCGMRMGMRMNRRNMKSLVFNLLILIVIVGAGILIYKQLMK
jgi:hypothetical protein